MPKMRIRPLMSLSKMYVHKQIAHLYDPIISQEKQLMSTGVVRPTIFFNISSKAYLAGPMLKPVLNCYLKMYRSMPSRKKGVSIVDSGEFLRTAEALLRTAKGEKDDLLNSIGEL